ncbi:hypothetical protein [Bradyrhizobium sp. CCBAU 51627]|nr:hypothetical protein [Bradyrhizobium sp. CCBAU 51627]
MSADQRATIRTLLVLDMAGCSLTVDLLGADTTALWDHPVRMAALK